jgi:hypothetical protein
VEGRQTGVGQRLRRGVDFHVEAREFVDDVLPLHGREKIRVPRRRPPVVLHEPGFEFEPGPGGRAIEAAGLEPVVQSRGLLMQARPEMLEITMTEVPVSDFLPHDVALASEGFH